MIFKQAFRVAFIALIWRQYKATIISSLALIVFLFLVGNIHDDYLAHTQLQGDSAVNSGASFIYKWLAYAFGVVTYLGFHLWRATRKTPKEKSQKIEQELQEVTNTDDDPFATIRERKKLRSRADFLAGDEE